MTNYFKTCDNPKCNPWRAWWRSICRQKAAQKAGED